MPNQQHPCTEPPRPNADELPRSSSLPAFPTLNNPLANLDFDARVPIPFSVFPSAYKNEQQTSEAAEVKTEERVTVQDAGR
ncbi:hypothetical protein KC318_g12831, partial [Hortaea werneckii]